MSTYRKNEFGIDRRQFLGSCVAGGVSGIISSESATSWSQELQVAPIDAKSPNILFVFADQLRSCDVGCYGGQQVRTPNMDRLAEQGVRFTHAISTYPICSPFRAMLMTGLYPVNNGMVCNDHFLKPGIPSFAMACRKAGYHTGYIGKWHIDGHSRTDYIPPERRLGFMDFMALECTHSYFESKYYEGESVQPKYWDGYDAEAQTRAAQNYIRKQAKKSPFALFLSWGPPHDPYIAPKKYMDRINASDIQFRHNVAEKEHAKALEDHPRFTLPEAYATIRKKGREWLNNEDAIRKATAGYLAATMALDDYLGDLINTLSDEGILDNTIIVFTSDHGDCLGSHRFYGKDTPFEESISIPMMIRYPAKITPGTTTDALFSPVDIMPTMLGLAGIDCPKVDGLDMSRIIINQQKDTRDGLLLMAMTHFCNASVINGMDTWRGIRTRRYTYARYEDGTPWLLYDNEQDPYQMENLVDDPRHAELRKMLQHKIDQLLIQANDPDDTMTLHDRILQEKPSRTMAIEFREVNPSL